MNSPRRLLPLLLSMALSCHTTAAPNRWVVEEIEYRIPERFQPAQWAQKDGFCDSLYRSRTGTVLVRDGLRIESRGVSPGFYSNATLEWNPGNGNAEVIDVFTGWGGGAYGRAALLPAFAEHPSPTPRHTYDGMAYDPVDDAVYMMLGANIKMAQGKGEIAPTAEALAQWQLDNNSLWKFSFDSGRWQRIDGNIRQFWNEHRVPPYETHLEYWPQQRKLLFLSGRGYHYAEYDIEGNRWQQKTLQGRPDMSVMGARSTWDSHRQRWVFRRGARVGWIDPASLATGTLPRLPARYDVIPPGRKQWHLSKSIAYIPRHDVYVVTGETGDDTFVFHIEEGRWEQLAGGALALPDGYMEYDPVTDKVVLVRHRDAFSLRYRPDAPAGAPASQDTQ